MNNSNRRSTTSKAHTGNWTALVSGWKTNMLSQSQRTTILELNASGVSTREIARVMKVSRLSVRRVLRSSSAEVPQIHRAEKAEPYRQQILELSIACKGNLVRVHEELMAGGAMLSYTALTAFCR